MGNDFAGWVTTSLGEGRGRVIRKECEEMRSSFYIIPLETTIFIFVPEKLRYHLKEEKQLASTQRKRERERQRQRQREKQIF